MLEDATMCPTCGRPVTEDPGPPLPGAGARRRRDSLFHPECVSAFAQRDDRGSATVRMYRDDTGDAEGD